MTIEQTEEQKQVNELEFLAGQAEKAEPLEGDWQQASPEPNQPANGMNTADIIATLLKISFGLVAAVKGEHWNLTDEVATEAADEYARCLDHYFPNIDTAPWVGAAMVTGVMLAPRIMTDNAIAAQKAKAEQDGTATEKKGVDDAD